MKKLLLASLCIALLINPAHAKDGKPFLHSFGELRVYYRDWLVVCENKGQGVCRMVNMKLNNKKDHFFGNSQLTIYPAAQSPRKSAMSEYNNADFISFFKRDLPPLQGAVSIAVDNKPLVELRANERIFDSNSNETSQKAIAMETYWLEGEQATQVLQALPKGHQLSITYLQNNNRHSETFSLSGAAQALTFIQQHLAGKTASFEVSTKKLKKHD